MNEVSKTVLEQLRDVGALPIAYAQLFSMNQFPQLGERADYFARLQVETGSRQDLSGMFEDEGSLNFDSI